MSPVRGKNQDRRSQVRILAAALLAGLLLLVSACATVEKKPESGEVMTEKALALFREGDYYDALERFKKLRDQYPFSRYSLLAELKIADCHFYLDEYDKALAAYENFEKEHPANEVIPYVIFQTIRCQATRMDTVDRDISGAREVLAQVARLNKNFPRSPYRKAAEAIAARARNLIAGHELYVADFYRRTGRTAEARRRLEGLIETWPGTDAVAEAKKMLAALALSGDRGQGTGDSGR